MPHNFDLNTIIETKKLHPCGGKTWKVIRVGADIKIECLKCARIVLLDREKFIKSIKKIIQN